MTELERKALLGDREAQEKLSNQGHVLSCPCCGGEVLRSTPGSFWCRDCGIVFSLPSYFLPKTCLEKYNTRPAPPVGRCKECQHYVAEWVGDGETIPAECIHPLTELFVVNDDDFCSCFEPKGDEGNEAQSCKS